MSLLSITLTPKTHADAERLAVGAHRLALVDDTISVSIDDATGVAEIAAVGDLQLEIAIERLKGEFHVEATAGRPSIAYKEALTVAAAGEAKYAGPLGPHGGYGHVAIYLEPGAPGSGFVFEDRTSGGAVPFHFLAPIRNAIADRLHEGVVAGYPVEDARVALLDGSYHALHSSESSFRTAASMAFRDAVTRARPVLLEPVMRVSVEVPSEFLRDVVADLRARPGNVLSIQDCDGTDVIVATVALAEMLGYHVDLRERTLGRGSYTMRLERYAPCQTGGAGPDRDSVVGAPLRPRPAPRASAIAMPEPDADDDNDGFDWTPVR